MRRAAPTGCRAALFLWIFSSISCRARTALSASRKYPFLRKWERNQAEAVQSLGVVVVCLFVLVWFGFSPPSSEGRQFAFGSTSTVV
uniref:Secreted protein n=1 Tax=Falco tinnunculus TaxID=100819 RepID=A0A8C4U6T9_FALTI